LAAERTITVPVSVISNLRVQVDQMNELCDEETSALRWLYANATNDLARMEEALKVEKKGRFWDKVEKGTYQVIVLVFVGIAIYGLAR
jgi:hypothetical protein